MTYSTWSAFCLTAACGVLAGNALYFVLASTGVAALILASSALFAVLQWAGAAYLVWQGTKMLLNAGRGARAEGRVGGGREFLRGFSGQVGNPKALVFFIALLPQFIDPQASLGAQLWLLGATSAVIELAVLAIYVALAARARHCASAWWRLVLDRIGGGVLIALGVRLALAKRELVD